MFSIQVNVSNIDPFDTWNLQVSANVSVLMPVSFSITGNMLGSSAAEFIHCVNGVGDGCGVLDNAGIVSSGVTSGGYQASGSGLLFTITYQVVGKGYSYLSIPPIATRNLILNSGSSVTHDTADGVYGTPPPLPVANFVHSPASPVDGDNVTFDASSSSDQNAGAVIVSYNWTFSPATGGRGAFNNVTSTPIMIHHFTTPLTFPITFDAKLVVTDNLGLHSKAKFVEVTIAEKPVRKLAVTDMAASPQDNILAGTRVTITVRVINQGTQPETGFNVTVLLEGRVVKTFNSTDTILRGFADYKSFQLDTTGWKADTYLLAGATNSSDPSTWAFVSIRIILPYQGASLPVTIPEFVGVIIVLLVAIGIVRLFLGGVQTKRRLREEALP